MNNAKWSKTKQYQAMPLKIDPGFRHCDIFHRGCDWSSGSWSAFQHQILLAVEAKLILDLIPYNDTGIEGMCPAADIT